MHAAAARTRRVTIRLSPEEHAALERRAAAFGMATAAYIADTALAGARDPEQLPLEIGLVDEQARLLRALLGLQREFAAARKDGHGPVVETVADQIHYMLLDLSRQLRDPRD